jgi:hypothetical protein
MGSVSVRVWRVGVIGWGSVCSSGLMYWGFKRSETIEGVGVGEVWRKKNIERILGRK